jgi:hypothetical protein
MSTIEEEFAAKIKAATSDDERIAIFRSMSARQDEARRSSVVHIRAPRKQRFADRRIGSRDMSHLERTLCGAPVGNRDVDADVDYVAADVCAKCLERRR